VLRLPNPGSDISGFVRIFQFLYEELKDFQPFSLDDMTEALIKNNLATSSGFVGEEALERSTRENRSLDPLYNQSKAYSELYRMLGWIHPQPDSKLNFSFTYLGAHAHEVHRSPKSFVEQCLIGVAIPNSLVESKGDYYQRPFACILRAASALDGKISRDEIIAGPMSLGNDRSEKGFQAMVALLQTARRTKGMLATELGSISKTRAITPTTMGNYTRFPLAVLNWTGWAQKERTRLFNAPVEYRVLTEKGRRLAASIESSIDLRTSDLVNLDAEAIKSLSKIAFYRMLERADFDVTGAQEEIRAANQNLNSQGVLTAERKRSDILFSPFQELNPQTVNPMFPAVGSRGKRAKTAAQITTPAAIASTSASQSAIVAASNLLDNKTPSPSVVVNLRAEAENLRNDLSKIIARFKGDLDQAADYLMEHYQTAKQNSFYPLVADLFCLLDFPAEASRMGVNYQRADVFINSPPKSIPIEVKSPTEELHISVKAIRQAVENKIILASRTPAASTMNITSLAVGYYLPNARAEVESLVTDIKKAYGISIGVIDFRSLLILVSTRISSGKAPNKKQIEEMCGIINVTNF
jgi:hypothetical protein